MLVAGLRFSSLWTQTTRPPIVHTTNSSKYDLCSHQNHNQQNVPLASLALPTHVWAIHASTRKQHPYLSHGAHPIGLTHFVASYSVLFNGKIALNHPHLDVLFLLKSLLAIPSLVFILHPGVCQNPCASCYPFINDNGWGRMAKAFFKYVRHTIISISNLSAVVS